MGSIIFDFLTESFLFDQECIDSAFGGLSDAEIKAELLRYREFCLANIPELESEAVRSASVLRVFAGVQRIDINTLKQSAFYIEQYVIPDPLFPFTHESSEQNDAMRTYFNMGKPTVDREGLAAALKYMKALTPMVAHDYVRFLPVTYLFEPPTETPVYYSPNYFDDGLPSALLQFFRDRADVRSLRRVHEGWIVEDSLSVGRLIAIQFRDHDPSKVFVQHLFEQQIVDIDEETGRFTARIYLPDTLPSAGYFDVWVRQSVNRAAMDFYGQLCTELEIGGRLGASYLSTSPFVQQLLTRFYPRDTAGRSEHTANMLLNVELPFLDNVDVSTLMCVRHNDGEVFQNFRNELDKQFFELRYESDPARFRAKAQRVVHELSVVQTHALAMKTNDLKRGALAQSVVVTATLAGGMIASGLGPVAALVAGAGIAKAVLDYRANVRSNPAYFLWKVIGG